MHRHGPHRNLIAPALQLALLLAGATDLSAQAQLEDEADPDFGLLLGISVWEELSFQAGLGYVFNQSCTEHFCFQEGVSLGLEYLPGDNSILGVRGSIWTARLLAAGFGVGYYADAESSTVLLQPEVGLGYSGVRFTFRVNIPTDDEVKRASDVELTATGLIDFF